MGRLVIRAVSSGSTLFAQVLVLVFRAEMVNYGLLSWKPDYGRFYDTWDTCYFQSTNQKELQQRDRLGKVNRRNQSTDITGGSIGSDCRLGTWSWMGTLDCFIHWLSKQRRPWSDAAFCSVSSWSALFANAPVQVLQINLFSWHSDSQRQA